MKIVIAGGSYGAEYIVSMLKGKGTEIVVINPSKEVASTILKRQKTPVYVGSPWRRYALEEANAYDADAFIALSSKDTDNYASCLLAKKVFNAKKCVCVVSNPKNVAIYTSLGIDSVISSSYLLNGKIIMIEAAVLSKYKIANKMLKDIRFPSYASICCIERFPDVIIPKGDTFIYPKDKLFIICKTSDQKRVMSFIRQEE